MKRQDSRAIAKAPKDATTAIGAQSTSNPTVPELAASQGEFEPRAASSPFPIVGIGASAGGLEALEQFLGHVPPGSGLAFVIVQHLDPTHKGMMPELLQRVTKMPVAQVEDRTPVRPDRVYVIPPNKDMSLLHGVLHLLEPAAPRGLRLPIDFFLRSLALDQQDRSIGVILSGMGSDGTLGLRDIKEKAGLVLVQEPLAAQFDSMPRSAIEAGLADIVAPASELPQKILSYLRHVPMATSLEVEVEDKMQSAFEKAVILLRSHTGHDFSLYKRKTLHRRIERRMHIHQIEKLADYVRYLQENSQELDLLFKELLIGVTSFFRDPAAWEYLRDSAIPTLLSAFPAGQPLRAWVAGCSTGEEAYSLAIIFMEVLSKTKPTAGFALQIFATDLDRDAISRARQGFYPDNIAADVSPERLKRFFAKEDHGYRVAKEIRDMIVFAPQNLIMDPPFRQLSILSCRNVLIYLAQELQNKLLPVFHYSLNPGGILFLGSADSVGSFTDQFVAIHRKERIFRRVQAMLRPEVLTFPTVFAPARGTKIQARDTQEPPVSLQSAADQLIVQRYSWPAVLVNQKGDILYVCGKTGKYLEPAAGKASWNILVMAREGVRYHLASALRKAIRQKRPQRLVGLALETNGDGQLVDIDIDVLDGAEPLRDLMMIVFRDVARTAQARETSLGSRTVHRRTARSALLERELAHAREELQTVREEMHASQEELTSTNEELQSANEELQSTNEELTTSKEEMQSLNEELQTVNTELHAKVEDLSLTNGDMKNLLNSTDIAIVFLDPELQVRRFTSHAAKIIKLIPSDVGRPITDLTSELRYPTLAEDARQVLRTLAFSEKPVKTRDGRWFTVRIMPYRTLDDQIDGVVITFVNITKAKLLESALRARELGLERRVARQFSELAHAKESSKRSPGSRRKTRRIERPHA